MPRLPFSLSTSTETAVERRRETPHAEELLWLKERVQRIREAGTERCVVDRDGTSVRFTRDGRSVVHFASNDYLGLAQHDDVRRAAADAVRELGVGTGSARLLWGGLRAHSELEAGLARLLGAESALLFGAGYLANIGALTGLATRDTVVFSDRAVHASVLDGIAISRCRHIRFPHNDLDSLERLLVSAAARRGSRQRFVVVTESIFSMDGDRAPLPALAELCSAFRASLVIDEAHALGVFGGGRGCGAALDAPSIAVVRVGTLSKALGSYGGFVAGDEAMRQLLCSTARPFLFQTSLPPAAVAAAFAALQILTADAEQGARLLERARTLSGRLRAAGVPAGIGSQIIPVRVASLPSGAYIQARLEERGVSVPFIRAPTVATGAERLRISLTAGHTEQDVDRLVEALTCIPTEHFFHGAP